MLSNLYILIPCLLALDRFCFYREDKPEFGTMGAYMFLKHFLVFLHVLLNMFYKMDKNWLILENYFILQIHVLHLPPPSPPQKKKQI